MSLNEVTSMAESLLLITAFNAVFAVTITFSFLFIRDKIAERKERIMRTRRK